VVGANRTKLGLKLEEVIEALRHHGCANRTKLGLKYGSVAKLGAFL